MKMIDIRQQDIISEQFNLMSWNIFKSDHKRELAFAEYVREIYKEHGIDIFCLQESKYSHKTRFPIAGFSINFASNLVLRNHDYGVTTTSHARAFKNVRILTTHRESVINTHKASLISHYQFTDDSKLTIVNIHAINFKSNKVYEYEFEKIKEYLRIDRRTNPIIVAGDFNTWNRVRIKLIKDFCREFGFKVAFLDDKELVKSFQNNPLDFVLYRGLNLRKAYALDCRGVSDHNPIVACFEKLN